MTCHHPASERVTWSRIVSPRRGLPSPQALTDHPTAKTDPMAKFKTPLGRTVALRATRCLVSFSPEPHPTSQRQLFLEGTQIVISSPRRRIKPQNRPAPGESNPQSRAPSAALRGSRSPGEGEAEAVCREPHPCTRRRERPLVPLSASSPMHSPMREPPCANPCDVTPTPSTLCNIRAQPPPHTPPAMSGHRRSQAASRNRSSKQETSRTSIAANRHYYPTMFADEMICPARHTERLPWHTPTTSPTPTVSPNSRPPLARRSAT
jgi:hypothetical protein